MTEWLLVLAGIALTLGTALFVAAEFALVALDRPSVEKSVERGDARARTVLTSLRSLSTQLSASQVGITLTTLVLGFLANPSIGALLRGPLESAGLGESLAVAGGGGARDGHRHGLLDDRRRDGAQDPRHLDAAGHGEGRRRAGALVRAGVQAAASSSSTAPRTRRCARMGVEPQEELSAARSPAELASLVRTSAEAGTLDLGTARLVTASLGFGAADRRRRHDPALAGHRHRPVRLRPRVRRARPPDRPLALPGHRRRLGRRRRRRPRQEGHRRAARPPRRRARLRPHDRRRSSCPRRSASTRCSSSCATAASSSPSSSTSTAAPRASSRSRTSSRRSSARCPTSTTAARRPVAR